MVRILGVLSIAVFLASCVSTYVRDGSCESLEACLSDLEKHSATADARSSGQSRLESSLVKQFDRFGTEGVDALVPLLQHSNETLADLAGASLREMSQIDEKYLPAILLALDSRSRPSWLAAALGKIDSPLAAEESVKRLLVSRSAPHNQEAYAVKLHGARSLPYIVEAAQCTYGCDQNTHYYLGHVLGDMNDPVKEAAAFRLMKSIHSAPISQDELMGIIFILTFLGESARVIEADLISLRAQNDATWDLVNQALVSMKSEESGNIMSYYLSISPDTRMLADLARTGTAGNSAGPVVMELLNDFDWDIREAAVNTLGAIGYTEAIPELVDLINEPSSMNINWAAVHALGQIGSNAELSILRDTAAQHWFPPVREEAEKSANFIEFGEEEVAEDGWMVIWGPRYDQKNCENPALAKLDEPEHLKLYDLSKLRALEYQSVIVSFGANNEEEQLAEDPDGIIEVNNFNMVEYREEVAEVPNMALRVNGGWLTGASRGEWGGELMYVPDSGQAKIVLDDNIEDIYKLGERYVAVAGLAHLGLNQGTVYELKKTSADDWFAEPWRDLPGAPWASWLVVTGELLIQSYDGGSVLLSENGSMRIVPCS